MIDIGIIGAMDVEVNDLVALLQNRSSETVSGITFYTGELAGKNVVIAKCGIGKVFAATCAEAMIIKYSPRLIINSGVGGALAKDLRTGDIVIADKLCQYDMDTSAIGDPVGLVSGINRVWFEADKRANYILELSAEALSLNARLGTIATGDKFVADKELKNQIVNTFAADACEMEGGAIAHVAFINQTPFVVIRAISDSADGGASMDYPTFVSFAAQNSASLTLALVEKY